MVCNSYSGISDSVVNAHTYFRCILSDSYSSLLSKVIMFVYWISRMHIFAFLLLSVISLFTYCLAK